MSQNLKLLFHVIMFTSNPRFSIQPRFCCCRFTKVIPPQQLHFSASPLPLGGDLCEVNPTLHCPVPASGGAEFPCHFHPQGNGSGGEVRNPQLHLTSQLSSACPTELQMFMEHEASSVNSTCCSSPLMPTAAVLIILIPV